MRRHTCLLGALCICVISGLASAADDGLTKGDKAIREMLGKEVRTVRLWPGSPPDRVGDIDPEKVELPEKEDGIARMRNVSCPTITVCRPQETEEPTPAVLVCPGGGYHILAFEHEGTEIVEWLNSLGVTGVLLKYRVPRRGNDYPKHHHALQDAQRALGLIRQNADDWRIDPDRVGILGFSAGGHLSATACNNYRERIYERVDGADEESCRPNFAVLVYPAYLTEPRDSDNMDPLQHADAMSRETTPPTFITVAQMDRFMRGATVYVRALAKAKVPAELHIYEEGSHGGGMRTYPFGEWTEECARWMTDHGYATGRLRKIDREPLCVNITMMARL